MKAVLLVVLAAVPELETALQKERESLEAERRSLETRLEELRVARREAEQAGMERIGELSRRLEAARGEASRLEEELVDRPDDTGTSGSLSAIFEEARELFSDEAPTDESADGAIDSLLSVALDQLERSRRVRRASGEFFAPSGRSVTGEILFVGSLAAFGKGASSSSVAGPLSRVGTEWALLENADVRALFGASGEPIVPLAIDGQPRDDRDSKGWQARLAAGGGLAFPILGLGVLVLLVALERVIALWVTSRGDEALETRLVQVLGRGAVREAQNLVEGGATGVARIARVSLRHRQRDPSDSSELAKSALVEELARVERRLPLLKLIAATAPLLGLLGTVMGMIETFDVISVYGSGDATRLSGGISKALVTTELGLLVAVPTLFIHGALASWVDRIADRLERCARDLPALVSHGEEP
ncbi:MAG TPA: MotA/TolQ/ExbB proton channel family protein [Myxococcales bacterium LLY-WYZ-16_1]|nr:MotA/TolQ/ExbB proton channel family protein [Myxococcales bacterium LLY-WYZ-16_1]